MGPITPLGEQAAFHQNGDSAYIRKARHRQRRWPLNFFHSDLYQPCKFFRLGGDAIQESGAHWSFQPSENYLYRQRRTDAGKGLRRR
jgi:hypothetical protein